MFVGLWASFIKRAGKVQKEESVGMEDILWF